MEGNFPVFDYELFLWFILLHNDHQRKKPFQVSKFSFIIRNKLAFLNLWMQFLFIWFPNFRHGVLSSTTACRVLCCLFISVIQFTHFIADKFPHLSVAVTHAKAFKWRKCISPDFEMETPPRTLIASMLISTLNPWGSYQCLYYCSSSVHLKIYLPEANDACFSTKNFHFNSFLFHVWHIFLLTIVWEHPESTSLPPQIHILLGDEAGTVDSPTCPFPKQLCSKWPSLHQKHMVFFKASDGHL